MPDRPSSASPQTIQSRERTIVPRMRRVVSESSTIRIRKSLTRDDISAPPDEPDAARGEWDPAVGSSPFAITSHGTVHDNRDHLVVDSGLINSRVKPAGALQIHPLYALVHNFQLSHINRKRQGAHSLNGPQHNSDSRRFEEKARCSKNKKRFTSSTNTQSTRTSMSSLWKLKNSTTKSRSVS